MVILRAHANDGPDTALARLLNASTRVPLDALQAALEEAREGGPPLSRVLVERGLLGREELDRDWLPQVQRAAGERTGRYELRGELARGGMGVVYRAWDPRLSRVVALKVLLTLGSGKEERARFEREAQATADLRHPHVIAVHDFGVDRGQPFLVMDLVEGESLARRLRRGPLDQRDAALWMYQSALGVHSAHTRGLLHRDLKPGNVLITKGGEAVVTDFGLAKRSVVDDQSLTASGEVLGTPGYMPPEQARGETVDERADVYSLGATLFALLTGQPPFRRASLLATLAAVVADPAPQASSLRSDLDPRLNEICSRCLAKDAADRYSSADEVALALRAYLHPSPAPTPSAGAWRVWVALGAGLLAGMLVSPRPAPEPAEQAPPQASPGRAPKLALSPYDPHTTSAPDRFDFLRWRAKGDRSAILRKQAANPRHATTYDKLNRALDNPRAHLEFAKQVHRSGDMEGVVDVLDRGMAVYHLSPGTEETACSLYGVRGAAWRELLNLKYAMADLDTALERLSTVASPSTNLLTIRASLWLDRGLALMLLDDLHEARADFRRVLGGHALPTIARQARDGLATIDLRLGGVSLGVARERYAAAKTPANFRVLVGLLPPLEAISLLGKTPEFQGAGFLAGLLWQTGQGEGALKLYEREVQSAGGNKSLNWRSFMRRYASLCDRGVVRYGLGHLRGAAEDFERSLRLSPNQPKAKAIRAQLRALRAWWVRTGKEHE